MRSAYMNFSGLIGYRAGSAGERRVIGAIPPYEITNNQTGRDVELPRGALTTLLYDVTEERQIRYRFNDSIETLEDDGAGIEIQFESGERHRYDVVIGADGLHSRARRLVFGPEERFNHYLGCCFNIFSMPNDMGLPHGGIIYSEVGRTAGGFAVRDSKDVFGFIIFASDKPPFGAHPDVEEQYQRTEAVFADGGWEAPRLLKAMRRAEDLYFDTVSQIRMPVWSSGRVVLVGDAAYAPSFRSGQGSSLALVGACVLAGELASRDDPSEAFAAYERITKPFVEANQALATEGNGFLLLPRTPGEVEARNRILASLAAGEGIGVRNDHARQVHSMLRLPDYTRWLHEERR
jgi:2-polyprenyl-6-methoxyphenol hydroxylase-like FAD-dependent oxidoreductase